MDDDSAPLPLAPLIAGPATKAAPGTPWTQRLREAGGSGLPVLLLGLLALATWWLVKNTPVPEPERPARAPTHEPDYEMHGFSMQRFTADGPAATVLEGRALRHYPDTDELDIQGVRLLWTDEGGRRTVATAERAVASGDGQRVTLRGDARVVRDAAPGRGAPRLEVRGQHLEVDARARRVRSDQPVVLVQGGDAQGRGGFELRAGTIDYDHASERLVLGGDVSGRILSGGLTP